nr:hypothetical protein [Tanacetum cinerariifolium]
LDKNKEGLGYNAVPPPPAQIYSPSKKDMSWTSLPEFKDDTANDSPTNSKTDKAETTKKPPVKYAEQYKKTSKKPNGSSQNNIDDKGYWDSGCSRHMKSNISYLYDYEPFDEGYVSFSQGGCKVTGKGTIKTSQLESKNVYFMKDLKHGELMTVGNKMHKAFLLLVRKFPLPEGTSHCLMKNATARRKEMPLPEDCTAVIIKKKLSVKDDSFLKISAPCPALYSSSN